MRKGEHKSRLANCFLHTHLPSSLIEQSCHNSIPASRLVSRHVYGSSRIRSWPTGHAILEASRSLRLTDSKHHNALYSKCPSKRFCHPNSPSGDRSLTPHLTVRIRTHSETLHSFQESPWNPQTWRIIRCRLRNTQMDRASQERRTTHKQ